MFDLIAIRFIYIHQVDSSNLSNTNSLDVFVLLCLYQPKRHLNKRFQIPLNDSIFRLILQTSTLKLIWVRYSSSNEIIELTLHFAIMHWTSHFHQSQWISESTRGSSSALLGSLPFSARWLRLRLELLILLSKDEGKTAGDPLILPLGVVWFKYFRLTCGEFLITSGYRELRTLFWSLSIRIGSSEEINQYVETSPLPWNR